MVLMLYRKNRPNINLWNGIGGKIEDGEDLETSLAREVMEEAGLDINHAKELFYAGVVSWAGEHEGSMKKRGMHAYIVELPDDVIVEKVGMDTDEGRLEWKHVDWVLDKSNVAVVPNIPLFLPEMLKKSGPKEYACVYENNVLKSFSIIDLE